MKIHSRAHPLVLGLAAAAVLYQGLIPAGYMPGTRADLAGGAPVVPCEAQGPVLGEPAMHHHHHGGGDAHKGHALSGSHSCVFAAAASAVLPTGSIAAFTATALADQPIVAATAALRAARLALLPPVRGPPALS